MVDCIPARHLHHDPALVSESVRLCTCGMYAFVPIAHQRPDGATVWRVHRIRRLTDQGEPLG